MLVLLLYGLKNSLNAIKSLNIITLRSVLNPGLAISISQFELLKWLLLFACAGRLIIDYFKIHDKSKVNKIIFPVVLYLVYSALSSFIFSNLPIVALMKILSYGFIFIGMLIGIYNPINYFDWIDWIYKQLLLIVIFSIPLIPFEVGYLISRISFQGITNQPNMFGIILVLFIAVNIVMLQLNKHKMAIIGHLLNILSFFLIWQSNSRTSLISALVLIFAFLILSNLDFLKKGLGLIAISLFSLFILINTNIFSEFQRFLFKGADDLLYSRAGQVSTLMESIEANPLFGTGFAVPVLPYRSYAISTEFIVEPGNLILSVLAYGGIIGFIIFNLYMLNIILSNARNFRYLIFLPLATVMISMGEMVFLVVITLDHGFICLLGFMHFMKMVSYM
ncbi:O-antigen ligase family protein [Aerococcus viridans]|uniref:O-antigen ligase family protein n=1 Tax=Aerococcus viridans TaxID=1377 RepID=UPI003AA7C4FC